MDSAGLTKDSASPARPSAAATFFTLLESCRRSGHNTFEYMADILARIGDHPVTLQC